MTVQIFRVPPRFFEHQNVLFQQVPVDAAAMTARFVAALLSHRSEDRQCLMTLLGWDRHPYGREYHVFSISGLLMNPAAVFNNPQKEECRICAREKSENVYCQTAAIK